MSNLGWPAHGLPHVSIEIGPEQSGLTTAMYLYRTGFQDGDFGTASAISWILFVIIAVLTWLNNKAFAPKHEESAA